MRTLFAVLSLSTGLGSGGAAAAPPLRLVQAIPLDGVEGRIDHLAADTKGQRLFVAALGNGTVEVVDLRSGRRSRRLRGFHEPQGLGFVASPPRLFVANGADGTCEVLHGETFTHLRTLRFSADADNVRYDPRTRWVYVGYGSGALGVRDAATGDSLDDIVLPRTPSLFSSSQPAHAYSSMFPTRVKSCSSSERVAARLPSGTSRTSPPTTQWRSTRRDTVCSSAAGTPQRCSSSMIDPDEGWRPFRSMGTSMTSSTTRRQAAFWRAVVRDSSTCWG